MSFQGTLTVCDNDGRLQAANYDMARLSMSMDMASHLLNDGAHTGLSIHWFADALQSPGSLSPQAQSRKL